MKRYVWILIFVFILFGGVASLYGKKIQRITFPKVDNKTITFKIYTGTDYSSSLYKRLKAEVELTIYKYSNGQKTLVWKDIVDESKIKKYPTFSSPVYREVTVFNVNDNKETLAVFYKVVYVTGKSNICYEKGLLLSTGSSTDSLNISL